MLTMYELLKELAEDEGLSEVEREKARLELAELVRVIPVTDRMRRLDAAKRAAREVKVRQLRGAGWR